jgi:hypothetical protein
VGRGPSGAAARGVEPITADDPDAGIDEQLTVFRWQVAADGGRVESRGGRRCLDKKLSEFLPRLLDGNLKRDVGQRGRSLTLADEQW